nr:immunoglobulin heavy chain junction region [Macaca mulatta]MOW45987.1 immunoglobulin heavy chain junction region [Macaca mulatta]MOW46003.1 immunoglobulin heavy chain junction region [Macaca mulatta]MOW46101.1 immunoglobulin heavy chain junction region [Macaca mulatta]MOW46147.1 immunoglobulin heavy chain junction region [Macaca mulatta]
CARTSPYGSTYRRGGQSSYLYNSLDVW